MADQGVRLVPASLRTEKSLQRLFASLLLLRLLYPFFDSPLEHLFSDPQRHWENGARLLRPSILGSIDPFLYQVWIYLLRFAAHGSAPAVALGSGLLCAAMPYGWYRALRELLTQERALVAACVIAVIPESVGIYAYFMNETLLLSLLGFCFWTTLCAHRKGTLAAFVLTAALWSCAVFTRTIALPMAAACLAWLWATQAQKISKSLAAGAIVLLLAIPAGLHSQAKLGFFAPLGNLYFNEIYSASGQREIEVNYGAEGAYHFGCPSFYNPTFYPFSDWSTGRRGIASIAIDLTQGRAGWLAEKQRMASERTFPGWRQRGEDVLYLLFGQSWPNSDRSSVVGWLTLWTRWVWAPLIAVVAVALFKHRYRGQEMILPICGLGTLVLLALQSEGVMEARFREPIDAILVCSALLVMSGGRSNKRRGADHGV